MQLSPEDPDNPEAKWVHSDQMSSMLASKIKLFSISDWHY